MIIKCGRREFDLNENDVIFDNGACFQITSQTYREGWTEYYPKIANAKAKKMIKDGELVLIKENLEYTTSGGVDVYYRYYKVKSC
jgi:hypothetical protein